MASKTALAIVKRWWSGITREDVMAAAGILRKVQRQGASIGAT
jgi:hypothetical protein